MSLTPAIRDWLPGPVTVARVLAGGFRNENLLLDNGLVLRRYRDASRCAVEVALARRLDGIVPVPAVVAADPDGTRAGEPVLLTEFVAGEPLATALTKGPAAELGRSVGEVLARIGAVTFERPGLFADGTLIPEAGLPGDLAAFVTECLDGAERAAMLALAGRAQPLLDAAGGASRLVHADFNPKNLLVDGTVVTAVLDWEFAFSGHPLADVGNLLRFEEDLPAGFVAGFVAGYGEAPDRELAAALDLFSLADLLSRPEGPLHARVRRRLGL